MTEAPPSICGGIMTSKHPQRCSNHCVHETKSPFLYGWGCNAVRDDDGRPINITVAEERLINKIGCALYSNHLELPDSCASHSSASEPVPEPGGAPNVSCDNDPCQFCFDGWCSFKCRKWDALVQTAATKARAEVLDELRDWSYTIGCNNAAIAAIGLRDRIESLRRQEGVR